MSQAAAEIGGGYSRQPEAEARLSASAEWYTFFNSNLRTELSSADIENVLSVRYLLAPSSNVSVLQSVEFKAINTLLQAGKTNLLTGGSEFSGSNFVVQWVQAGASAVNLAEMTSK